ncbi:MAG: rhomboid family intramembrane serine protease [Gammaproteobacteria bacterium]|jgi:membrane associated rhomboid family serine protease|uniref:rhomboid family intramembrane serine protease n=1 Tax=Pseudomonas sp. TaxID=306 RepID=UPI001D8FA8EA|nr:rhomboid family intramembrane serine protease [Gammaproteobacteria bacterium]MBU2157846.1 rhomboid family intramembrane serine protease [Gammaproteobacteria bacterium]MBU2256623.1 rhomboid family intramembrane serine protease [Gammaproteobacteria bacterium]MBU2293512.1 rhomboid family intramembrane serine protease [Gammaproteobacteria bacterium]
MLILPAEHPLDWKRPPVLTLLLIVLNCLIYFAYQGGDTAREQRAVSNYLQGGLLEREKSAFIESFGKEHELTTDEQQSLSQAPQDYLAELVLNDLQFEQQLHDDAAYQAAPDWQRARQAAEAARDQISLYRFGFIPAKFSVQGLFGAMFLHADVDHLLGNMLFLFIFGFALEIALGRGQFLVLYLISGVASHLLWWLLEPVWVVGIGASGAISGLMGMYLGVYGLRRINFFYWLGPLFGYFRAPALWILPLWMGKELLGMLENDHVNHYAHLGGLGAGFLLVWLPHQFGRLKVDQEYLHKEDPDAPFKRELAALGELIGRFALDEAARRGPDLLQRYPARLPLLERLYPVATSRQDRALLGALLKQLFALPASPGQLAMLEKLADDSLTSGQPLLQQPSIQLYLLQSLLRARQSARALNVWRKLSNNPQPHAQLPAMTLALAKQLAGEQPRTLRELLVFLQQSYPDSEPTRLLAQFNAHLG